MSESKTEYPIIPPEDGSARRILPSIKNNFRLKNTFAALRHRNYRIWFWGQMISLFGSWMQNTALAFFVYELTKSPAFLGYVGFAGGIPAWILTFYAGVAADRFDRRKILIYTQSGMMFLSLILSLLTITGIIESWHILLISAGMGTMNTFDAPARHAFVNEMVPREDMVNAIALNSTMFNTATSIGPALGGIIYALLGPAACFVINTVSFMAVLIGLLRMNVKPIEKAKERNSVFKDIKEGFGYLFAQKTIMAFVLIVITISLFGISLVTIFPAWAVNILSGDATTNGFMQSARGVGAVIFALIIATVNKYVVRGRILSYAALAVPIVIIVFSFNRSFVITLLLLALLGGLMIVIYNLCNGLIQTLVDEKFRGRIMSLYTFSFLAFAPLGSLLIGSEAELVGIPTAVQINGIILLLIFSFIIYRFPRLKKII
ncbi:major facilitator transporter [Melioribacter roseus P3M-2]|uniref:Major facilitator transporter n=1 Tax=Melioribacter roseus (strain DSM 23840 / JCM 17771 / VKM B-2668 / P3M-2) TaxID=1191523 RepID=I7A1H8_MELRP|nr:MFS transporter [Melioribacter roseus]AFN73846.1 major facilitator transporter [Melioribacter roseus P3M-2]